MSDSSASHPGHHTGHQLGETLLWAIESEVDPAMAAADWLARDIDPQCASAMDLLTTGDVSLEKLGQAKDAFKTMRVVGETSADRRLGAKLYAAAIAAALVRHGRRISRQSDAATRRALLGLLDDDELPEAVRSLAGAALSTLGGPSKP